MESDLQALQRLYGLLENESHGLSNTTSDVLDEHARFLLKKLLDAATQKVFKVHSEIIGGQARALWTFSPIELQKRDDKVKKQSSPFPNSSLTAEVSKNYGNNVGSDQEREPDGSDTISWKHLQKFPEQGSRSGAMGQSKLTVGSEYRKTRCRVCRRSTVKKLKSVEEAEFYDGETENSNKFVTLLKSRSVLSDRVEESLNNDNEKQVGIYDNNLSVVGPTGSSSNRVVTGVFEVSNSDEGTTKKSEVVDRYTREVSEAIKKIQLSLSDLQIGADNLHLFEESTFQLKSFDPETNFANCSMQTKEGTIPVVERSQSGGCSVARNDMLCKESSVQDFVDFPYQVPSRTTKEMKLPYLSQLVKQTNSMVSQSTCSKIRTEGLSSGRNTSYNLGESAEEWKLPVQKVNQACGQKVKAVVDNIESGTWRTGRNDSMTSQIHNTQNFSFVPDHNVMCNRSPSRPTKFLSESKKENLHNYLMSMEKIGKHGTFKPYMPASSDANFSKNSRNVQSVDSGHNVAQTWGIGCKKHLPQKKIGQTLLDKGVVPKNCKYMSPGRKASLRQQESEGTTSSSYSSNWTSQKASNYGSEGEEYQIRRLHNASPGTRSESGDESLLCGTQSQYTSSTNNSENEVYSLTSSAAAQEVTSSSIIESKGYSSYDKPQPKRRHAGPTYSSMESVSGRVDPGRIHKSVDGINHKKRSGKWKRLKDRLAVIFHHHHHHHHHNGNEDCDNHQTKMSRYTSFQKHNGKNFHPRREDEAYGERAVENLSKSVIQGGPGKSQYGHFHGLMEGLLRHVDHSKKSKPVKESTAKLDKSQPGGKKALKKSPWGQLLQHQRAKYHNKPHVKLGIGKKKTRLKALPKMK
ncbi:uncharacterized protein Fot_06699 [Forsythia ovata]|uniref:Uncharacterized protein n=1 Tax=Forsythia ovata TaxID=205694 RepID=A0ABD1WTP7_9LAMI